MISAREVWRNSVKRARRAIQNHSFGVAFKGNNFVQVENKVGDLLRSKHLRGVFQRLKVNCVFDVGANRGQYARNLRGSGFEGHIISFEPMREAYLELERAAAGDPRWKVYNLALGSVEAVESFNVAEDSVFNSFLAPNTYSQRVFGAKSRVERVEEVSLKRLDGIYEEAVRDIASPRVFLKMDTQGYDLEVVRGGQGCMQSVLGLQSELSLIPIYEQMPDFLQALRTFQDLGFELTALFPVTREVRTLRVIELDCVMIRAAAVMPDWAVRGAGSTPRL
jgi:FkbM family methyltransferase